jgi:hypothetical protein
MFGKQVTLTAHFSLHVIDSCPCKSMDKLQDLSQSELEDLLDNTERVESMALESDEVSNHVFALSHCLSIVSYHLD